MYTPHTVTVYNRQEDPSTLAVTYNITVLSGVFLDMSEAANIQKTGLQDADRATLFIPFSVTATDGTTGATKQYLSPNEYNAKPVAERGAYWTLNPGGSSSGVDCFFVKGNVASNAGYKTLRKTFDFVFDVTTVDIRDFGSEDMQHWQVGGR